MYHQQQTYPMVTTECSPSGAVLHALVILCITWTLERIFDWQLNVSSLLTITGP